MYFLVLGVVCVFLLIFFIGLIQTTKTHLEQIRINNEEQERIKLPVVTNDLVIEDDYYMPVDEVVTKTVYPENVICVDFIRRRKV